MLDENQQQQYPPLEDPDKPDPFYAIMEPYWEKLETVMEGAQALKDKGVKYTPMFEGESNGAYKARLLKTDLTNVLEDSVDNAVARPFAKEFILDADTDKTYPKFIEWAKDIDMQGSNLHDFGKEVFEQALIYAWAYILVDYPNTEGRELTKKDIEDEGIRPYAMFLSAQSVISYRTAKVEGYQRPVYIRYRTFDHEYEADGTAVEVRRVHEIRAGVDDVSPGYYRNYESRKSGKWKVISEGYYPFNALTCVRYEIGKRRGKHGAITPTFMGLCEKNIAHWNSSSDQTNILTRTRFAIYHFKGLDLPRDEKGQVQAVTLGPDTILTSSAEGDSEIQVVTLPTTGIEQGWTDLDRKEAEMRIMGLEPLSQDSSNTATGRQLDDKKTNSLLEGWALDLKDKVEQAIRFMGIWADVLAGDNKVEAIINTSFGVTNREINEIKMFQDMNIQGQLSRKTLLEESKRRQMFDPKFDVDAEITQIKTEQSEGFGYDLDFEEANNTSKSTSKNKKTKQADKISEMEEKVEVPEAA